MVLIATACVFALAAPVLKQDKTVVRPAPQGEIGIYQERLRGLRLGAPQQHRGLTVYPLTGRTQEPFYHTLDEALRDGSLVVEELSRVNEVRLTNKGSRPVLILDGEEILGAKQNRVFNSSMLAPAGKTLIAHVSCVEHGRWSGVSDRFEASGAQLFARARQSNQAAVGASMSSAGAPLSDQSRVWAHVAAKNRALGVPAETQAMHKAYEAKSAEIGEFTDRFLPAPGQVGAVFALHGRIVGLDLFDSEKTLKQVYPKLLKSYALDAIGPVAAERGRSTLGDPGNAAEQFLAAAAKAAGKAYDSQGEGSDLRLSGWKLTGSALVARLRVVHASVFAGDVEPVAREDDATSIAPPRVRVR